MKLKKPEGNITQPFGANANPSYKGDGLKGHTGEDYVLGFKKQIKAVVTGEVYSLLNFGNKDTNKYRAIYQIVNDTDFSYEISYGHIDKALCKEGDVVHAGENIGTEGNWGTCYVGGKLVTPEEKATGKGSHLHFQVRKLKRVKKRNPNMQYIRNSEGFVKRGGFFYEVVNYDNGYNGCINPSQFYPIEVFTRDLDIGSRGKEVIDLQKFLISAGYKIEAGATGYFGEQTQKALSEFQKNFNIKPSKGYFGKVTRDFINSLY